MKQLRALWITLGIIACIVAPAFAFPPPLFPPMSGGVSSATPTPTPTGTPTPPPPAIAYVLQGFTYVGNGSGGAAGADAGAADPYIFYGMQQGGSAPTPNPSCAGYGTSGCSPYYYADFTLNGCLGAYQTDFITWANANDENAYFHIYNGTRTSSNRYSANAFGGTSGCAGYGLDNTHSWWMNLTDPAAASWVYANYIDSTIYHAKKDVGLWEDDWPPGNGAGTAFCQSAGYAFIMCSTEYGEPNQAWLGATSGNGQGLNALAAFANLPNGICQGFCAPLDVNGYVGTTCSVVSAGHCYGSFAAGGAHGPQTYDNHLRLQDLCAALTGTNFRGITAEAPIHAATGGFLASYRWTNLINTAADLINNHGSDNCKNIRIIDLENPAVAATVRSYIAAVRWLVPSADGTPDFYILNRYTYGQSATETSFFPEDTLVPSGPEQPLLGHPYVFNGTTLTDGTGCASGGRDGDTGGAPSLIVYCSAGSAVYCEQYQHLWYAQTAGTRVDLGKAMACVNPTGSAVNFSSMTFTGDPFSTYQSAITWTGDELPNSTTLYYAPGQSGGDGCTNPTYCTGALNLNSAIPTSIAADSGVLLYGSGGSPPSGGTVVWQTGLTGKTAWITSSTNQCGTPVQVGGATGTTMTFSLSQGTAPDGLCGRNQFNPECGGFSACYLNNGATYLFHFVYRDSDANGNPPGALDCNFAHAGNCGTTTSTCPGGASCIGDARNLVWQIHPNVCSCTPVLHLDLVNGPDSLSSPQRWGIYTGALTNGHAIATFPYTAGATVTWDLLVTISSPQGTANGAITMWKDGVQVYTASNIVTMSGASNTSPTTQWWNLGIYRGQWEHTPNDSFVTTVNETFDNIFVNLCPC